MNWNSTAARKVLLTSCAAIALSASVSSAYAQSVKAYAIQEQRLGDALRQFAVVSGRDLSFTPQLVQGKTAHGISGDFSEEEALALLLAGTGLEFEKNTAGVIVIHKKAALMKTAETPAQAPQVGRPVQSAAVAAPAASTPAPVEEVVVTGSRIVREGYEAPTPLTVVSSEQLQNSASPNLMSMLNDMPALAGSAMTTNTNGATTNASAGNQNLNLRGLGANRTLVLLDGRRLVGADYNGAPNVGSIPQQLIERVDIVTGGASAVYGSDAVAGVVNFVLNKKFTGVKGELSGGLTNYGDDKNYKIDLSAGFGFGPDDRGHVLFSGEHLFNQGVPNSASRDWALTGTLQVANPNYTAANGQPQQLIVPQSSLGTATAGGLIQSGPLKGTAFGAGGAPYKFSYGSIFSSPLMSGGDWQSNDIHRYMSLDSNLQADNLFTRVGYDITDNINAFVQYDWSQVHARNIVTPPWVLSGLTVQIDNAYLPASTRAAMVANNLTQFAIGSWNADLPLFGVDNTLVTNRLDAGFEGKLDAFDTMWHWNVAYSYGSTKQGAHAGIDAGYRQNVVLALYRQSIDAVVNPATGQIVCRIALTTPTTTCKPWNVMGIGVNSSNTASFIRPDFQFGLIQMRSYTASITGEPFSSWAGPVSVAASFEHRKDSVRSVVDPTSTALGFASANHGALNGEQSVTEGALETVIPLAKGENWAQAWDLNLAARFTGYELSGFVTTYKIGTTYTPIDDIKLRATYSRDIRAPSIQDLFVAPNGTVAAITVTDPQLNQTYAISGLNLTAGNPNLKPEKANTLGLGVVFTPTFIDGFTASIDFWDADISGAIQTLSQQQVIDLCYTTGPSLCSQFTRDASGRIASITRVPINLAVQDVRGLDLEATYRMPVSNLVDDWRGNFSLHGNMTIYLRNYKNDTFSLPADHVGENTSTFVGPPNWKFNVTATYSLDPVTVALTGRAVSSGVINTTYIECTSGCPASTPNHITINNNHIPGAFYMDANVNYNLDLGDTVQSQLFLSVKNIFNHDAPWSGGIYTLPVSGSALYDTLGTVYRAGLRFKM